MMAVRLVGSIILLDKYRRKVDKKPDLLSCTFCSGKAKINTSADYAHFFVYCNDCGATDGKYYDTEKEAIAAWNRRGERTCHIEAHGTWLYCSSCRACVNGGYCDADDADDAADYHAMRFCPSCGAKVTDDAD